MSKRFILFPISLFPILLLLLGSVIAQLQVGLVLSVKGEGQLLSQGEARELRLAEALFAGDQLYVKTGEASFLFCPSQELVKVQAGVRLVFDESSYKLQEGPSPISQGGRKCTLPKVALGAESLERVAALRARGFPPIVVYLGGQVSTSRPVLSWEPIEGTEEYEIRVKDPRGRVLLEGRSSEPQWQPAEDLASGSFQWEVQALDGDQETLAQQQARFVIVLGEIEASAGEEDADLYLNATLFENAGYYAEAAAYYRALRKSYPEDARITSRLAWLYWNSGLIAAANLENEKLRDGSEGT